MRSFLFIQSWKTCQLMWENLISLLYLTLVTSCIIGSFLCYHLFKSKSETNLYGFYESCFLWFLWIMFSTVSMIFYGFYESCFLWFLWYMCVQGFGTDSFKYLILRFKLTISKKNIHFKDYKGASWKQLSAL